MENIFKFKSPIERMLDNVEWKRLDGVVKDCDLPVATHLGYLHIESCKPIKVYQMDNGQRIISEEGMTRFYEYLSGQPL